MANRETEMRPFTVIKDWDAETFHKRNNTGLAEADAEPQMFHVWARTGSDASDEADRMAEEKWGRRIGDYLHPVAVLRGHVQFATD